MKTTTFETSEVGDKVWSIDSGWGEIRARYGSVTYPIGVYFSNGEYRTYTVGGLYTEYDKTQSLFWDEVKNEAPEKPMPVLQVDAKKVSELRDHIAIAYMQSCVTGNAYFETFEGVSSEAYKMADAMLEERYKSMLAAAPTVEQAPEVAKLVEALEQGFPLLSDEGLDEVEHHCEWAIQRERKRVHSILATLRQQGA